MNEQDRIEWAAEDRRDWDEGRYEVTKDCFTWADEPEAMADWMGAAW